MSRKVQSIVSLSLTAIVIAILVWIYLSAINNEPPEVEEEPARLVSLIQRNESEIANITFYTDGVRTYLTPFLDEHQWLLWEYSAAEGFVVNQMVLRNKAFSAWALVAADIVHENTDGLHLAEFGLAPPVSTITVDFTDGTQHTIKLGELTGDRQNRFLMFDQHPEMYLFHTIFADFLTLGVTEMLDLTLQEVNFADADFISVSIRDAEPMVFIASYEHMLEPLQGMPVTGLERLFMVTHREDAPVDIRRFANLTLMPISHGRLAEYVLFPLSHFQLSEAVAVQPADLAPFGLDEPILVFELRTQNPHEEVIWKFGDTFTRNGVELIYFMDYRRPHVFAAEFSQVAGLMDLQPLDIIERMFALVPLADVERTLAIFPEGTFDIVYNHIPDTFEREPTVNGRDADPEAVRQVFQQIIMLRVDSEIPGFASDESPLITITHFLDDGSEIVLAFYNFNVNFLAVGIDGALPAIAINRIALGRVLAGLQGL